MFSLIIETSTERGCVAFYDGQDVIFQEHFPFGLNNSKFLLPEIARGFKMIGKSPQEIDYIAVGIGPGSYTGIRIGAITAKTLAFALKKPLVTFCSLEAFKSSQKEKAFAVIVDAKISGVYMMAGQEPAQIVPLNDLGVYLRNVSVLVTPNQSVIKPKIEGLYPDHHWVWEESLPNVLHLSQLAAAKFEEGDFSDGRHIDLLYLRKTQAEIEKEKKELAKV